jgi:hypothetical protein
MQRPLDLLDRGEGERGSQNIASEMPEAMSSARKRMKRATRFRRIKGSAIDSRCKEEKREAIGLR